MAMEEFPESADPDMDPDKCQDLHRANAEKLGKALIETLPGGTIDQLLGFLLAQKASRLIVPYSRTKGGTT